MNRKVLILCLLVAAIGALPALAADVTVVSNFPGNKGPGWKDTIDVSGAVGPKHVVDFNEGGFVVHDKATGKELQRFGADEYWKKVESSDSLVPERNANDMRIIYDPLSERWFAASADNKGGLCRLAVSTSSDPTKPWKGALMPLPKKNPYMKLGVDKNGLYVCSYNGQDMSKAMNCYAIPKADVIAAAGPVTANGTTFTDMKMALMPAMDLDPDKPADAPEALLVNEFDPATCGKLYMHKITWSGTKASITEAQAISLSKTYHTRGRGGQRMDVAQPPPGPKIRGDSGRRIESVFAYNGSVFGCNNAMRTQDSRVGILWYEIRIKDGALLQEGFVDDPKCDYIYPTLAVDAKGNVGIGCTRLSETEFASVCVMMRAAGDPPNTMRAPIVAVPGTTSYRYPGTDAVSWSHYSSTCVDPSNPNLLWTTQAYSTSTTAKEWCTAWAAFQLATGATKPATAK